MISCVRADTQPLHIEELYAMSNRFEAQMRSPVSSINVWLEKYLCPGTTVTYWACCPGAVAFGCAASFGQLL